jgi:thiosulfate/3-mercaptopyruvate sulfurtransferase
MAPLTLPSALVDTQWLANNIGHTHLVILDASAHMPGITRNALDEWREQCIPGARFFDFNHKFADTTSNLPHMLPSEKTFTEEARQLGINQDSVIVVYDSAGIFSAPRAWWMLTTMGHQYCAVLDGGLPEWLAQGRKTGQGEENTRGAIPVVYGHFTARVHKENIKTAADISAAINRDDICILDSRSEERFNGTAKESREGLASGHIPSSKNLPFNQLINNGKFRSLDYIESLLNAKINSGQQLYASCGSGITACIIAFAAHLIGIKNIAVYDGSWCEWGDPKHQHPIDTLSASPRRAPLMLAPIIIHNHASDEYFFEEGCYILEVSNSEKDGQLSIARARLSPGTETRLHRLNKTIERYIIVSGEGEVTLGDETNIEPDTQSKTRVSDNDVVIIPENYPQMIRNTGLTDLVFFVVCTPRFIVENYSDC